MIFDFLKTETKIRLMFGKEKGKNITLHFWLRHIWPPNCLQVKQLQEIQSELKLERKVCVAPSFSRPREGCCRECGPPTQGLDSVSTPVWEAKRHLHQKEQGFLKNGDSWCHDVHAKENEGLSVWSKSSVLFSFKSPHPQTKSTKQKPQTPKRTNTCIYHFNYHIYALGEVISYYWEIWIILKEA